MTDIAKYIKFLVVILVSVTPLLGLVTEEDDWSTPRQWSRCPWGYRCSPISSCWVLKQLAKSSCLISHRSNSLVCGYQRGEALVCCPETCSNVVSAANICGSQPQLSGSQLAFPWVVRVSFINKDTGQKAPLCIGSIISRRVILTAAHCALAKTKSHKIQSVRLDAESCCGNSGRDIPLSHIVLHPAYRPLAFSHNIALLVLKQPLNFTRSVQPVCLPEKNESILYFGQRGIMVGWGKLSGQIVESGIQEMVDVPLLPESRCTLVYGSKVKITEDMLCAGGEGRDACSGFGGAPLVVIHPTKAGKYHQVGMLSFGADKCGSVGVPSVFTKIDSYIDWIQANSPQDPD